MIRKMRSAASLIAAAVCAAALAGCTGTQHADTADLTQETTETTITVFAAKSLHGVLDELIAVYEQEHAGVTILASYDSSGTLMTQIREGASCDVFFSAAQTQMDELLAEGFIVDGSRRDVVNNQVCVVTYAGSGSTVTGLLDMGKAKSIALADGSVPVGKYTREAMIHAGMLPEAADAAAVTAEEISKALDGVEINVCANVGAVVTAVAEGANEVGTVYYSDTYGFEEKLELIQVLPYELTGDVIYPAAAVVNTQADDAMRQAALDFTDFLVSDAAREVFGNYYFDTDVQ